MRKGREVGSGEEERGERRGKRGRKEEG